MGMGQTAELVAREGSISREQQDQFAETSHLKALANSDIREKEITPYHLTNDNCLRSPSGKIVTKDNGPRNDSTVKKLGKLRTVFDRSGTVTAGNASQVTDGGAALLLMTEHGLEKTGATPIAKIVNYAYAGCDPRRMGLGPIHAINKLLAPGRKLLESIDLFEINEAFAAQVIACTNELQVPSEKLNTLGGAIALGHPLAATGARLVLSLAKNLQHKQLNSGLASLCVGGGQGGALWIMKV